MNTGENDNASSGVQALLDAAPSGTVIVNAKGDIVALNDAWIHVTADEVGASRDQLIGKNFFAATRMDAPGVLPPDERARMMDVIEARCDEASARCSSTIGGQLRWFDLVGNVVMYNGHRHAMFKLIDVTMTVDGQGATFRAAQVLDSIADVIVTLDAAFLITWCNRTFCSTYDLESADVVGKRFSEVVEIELTVDERDDVVAQLTAFGTWSGETRHRVDGRWVLFQTVTTAVVDGDGVKTGYTVVNRDITENRRLTREVAESQKLAALGQFAASIAHDVNNILGIVSLASGILQDSLGTKVEELDDILTATDRGARLVRELLLFARARSGRKQDVDVRVRIEALMPLLRRSVSDKATLHTWLTEKSLVVRVDPVKFDQVLLNLVGNAKDAVSDAQNGEGHVWVYADRDPDTDEVFLVVKDDGMGIPADVKEKIFEPYFTTKSEKGTGLGLATVAAIVTESGASIVVDSEVGKGTSFRVTFPPFAGV